jgi:hypothetical protein
MGRSWKGESAEQGRAAAAAAAAEMWPPCCCSRTLFTAHRLCQLDGTLRDSKGERMKTRNRRRAEEGGGGNQSTKSSPTTTSLSRCASSQTDDAKTPLSAALSLR